MVAGGVLAGARSVQSPPQELASARASLSPDHPRVQSPRAAGEQLRSHIRAGGGGDGVVGSNSTYVELYERAARTTKSELTTLLARQNGLIDDGREGSEPHWTRLSGIEGEASTLLAEVGVNEAMVGRLQANGSCPRGRPGNIRRVGSRSWIPAPSLSFRLRTRRSPSFSGRCRSSASSAVLRSPSGGSSADFACKPPRRLLSGVPAPCSPRRHGPTIRSGWMSWSPGSMIWRPRRKETCSFLAARPMMRRRRASWRAAINADWFVDGPMAVAAVPAPSAPSPHQRGPLTTPPPPSGPYPVGGSPSPSAAPAQPSTALALRPVQLVRREQRIRLEAWDGPFEGQALRRAARLADRVIVLVRSDGMTALALSGIRRRIGRKDGIGYIVLALPEELGTLPDRVGDVVQFWQT